MIPEPENPKTNAEKHTVYNGPKPDYDMFEAASQIETIEMKSVVKMQNLLNILCLVDVLDNVIHVG